MTEQEAIKEIKRWTGILMNAGSKCVAETAEAQDMAIAALEKQIAKKPIYKEAKYKEHKWRLDEGGKINHFAFVSGYCNGPVCERCHYSFCEHCNPNGYGKSCIVKRYTCPTCNQKVAYKQNFCDCSQKLDWD